MTGITVITPCTLNDTVGMSGEQSCGVNNFYVCCNLSAYYKIKAKNNRTVFRPRLVNLQTLSVLSLAICTLPQLHHNNSKASCRVEHKFSRINVWQGAFNFTQMNKTCLNVQRPCIKQLTFKHLVSVKAHFQYWHFNEYSITFPVVLTHESLL